MTMKRLLLLLFLTATAAPAQTAEDALIADMQTRGFALVEREISLRGRVVLEFESEHIEREIIFDPPTGQILRDFTEKRDDSDDNESWWEYLLNPFDRDDD
jgi:hypothetical protein